jgi:hypothetical protein
MRRFDSDPRLQFHLRVRQGFRRFERPHGFSTQFRTLRYGVNSPLLASSSDSASLIFAVARATMEAHYRLIRRFMRALELLFGRQLANAPALAPPPKMGRIIAANNEAERQPVQNLKPYRAEKKGRGRLARGLDICNLAISYGFTTRKNWFDEPIGMVAGLAVPRFCQLAAAPSAALPSR